MILTNRTNEIAIADNNGLFMTKFNVQMQDYCLVKTGDEFLKGKQVKAAFLFDNDQIMAYSKNDNYYTIIDRRY